MTSFVGLLPALALFGGALLYVLPLPFSSRYRPWVALSACAIAAASLLWLARETEAVVLFPPEESLPTLTLSLQWSGTTVSFGLFALLITCGRFLFGRATDSRAFVCGALAVLGGALLFFAADSWNTLGVAWLVVEMALLTLPAEQDETRARAGHALGWNFVALVLWFAAGMMLSNQGSSLRLSQVQLEGMPLFFVMLAIWIRSGVYPFHSAAPSIAETLGMRVGLPLLLGGYLMTRVLTQIGGAMSFQSAMEFLALAALGASALVVVGHVHGGEALTWSLRAFGATLLLLPFFADARIAAAASLLFALGAYAVAHFLEIAMQWRAELPRVRLPLMVWVIVLAMLAGLPLAPTFWSRVALVALAYAETGIGLWLLLVATMSLTLIPIWREVFASSQVAPRLPTRFEYAALAFILLPALALSVAPLLFMVTMGADVRSASAQLFDLLFKPANAAALIFLLAGLAIPLLISFELARRWTPHANLLPTRVSTILDLSALARATNRVYQFSRGLIQQTLTLLEQPPIAWLLFLAIWVAIWIIGIRS